MRYFSKSYGAKTSANKIETDLTRGLRMPWEQGKNSISRSVNFTADYYPWLGSRNRMMRSTGNFDYSDGFGIHNGVVYFCDDCGFWYDGERKFDISEGKKKFSHYNGKILIFPDMMYYDPSCGEYNKFGVSTGQIPYKIANRNVAGVDWGMSCISSDEVNLTDFFEAGDGIKITGNHDVGIGGFHTIIGTDKKNGVLFFNKCEFGEKSDSIWYLTGTLSHGAPQSCDAACVCGGRVWVAGDNKIYASTINDEHNWAVGGDDDKSSFVCDFDREEKITACIEFEGSPIFFSNTKIYKIYGDRASNFNLRCCADWGGIPDDTADTVAVLKNKIFYLSRHGLTVFDGNTPRVIYNLPFEYKNNKVIADTDGKKYYVCVIGEDGGEFYVYDELSGQWHDWGQYSFSSFFVYRGALGASRGNTIYWIDAPADIMPVVTYEDELSTFVEAEISTGGKMLSKVVVDCQTEATSEYSVHLIINGGEERKIGEILGAFDGCLEFMIVPTLSEKAVIRISGKHKILIKSILAELI
ncbi:MAG: hypothetical protein E7667_05440 [Ruminococcaceae bacterium]|nr:hypothetical protein [Oscillospiraceae bacterium]